MLRYLYLRLGPLLLICLMFGTTSTPAADFTEPTTGMEFVRIKGGAFTMGDIYGTGLRYERPQHKVTLPEIIIGAYEVTFAQYDQFCEATKRAKPSDEGWGRGKRPAINVSWQDAVAFAEWLSKQSPGTYRLPSEAEWEYAARGGTGSDFWWGMQAGRNNANCKNCGTEWSGTMTAPVGTFPPNPFGLYDMNGNVYEWCTDTFHPDYKGAPADGSARQEGNSDERMMRSGSFYRDAFEMRNSTRAWDRKDSKLFEYGFRLVYEP